MSVAERSGSVWPRSARWAGGALTVAGVDVRDIAGEFGTPVYVLDEDDFRSRCRDYRHAFGGDGAAGVYYAGKAFLCKAVVRWVAEEGLGLDVCTGGELAVALAAGFPPERIAFHGNNKSVEELGRALDAGVGRIVVDSLHEIARLGFLAEQRGVRARVLLRVTTGVEAHTHEYIATAHDDQKFGFALTSGAAAEAVRHVCALSTTLELVGLHSHIGSQIFDTAGFEVATHRMVELMRQVRDEHGLELAELDLGGGLGVAYVHGDDPLDAKVLAENLRGIVTRECAAADLPVPRLSVEPGRAVVGPAGITLYEVGTVKDVEGLRCYVSVDGGMSDNIRTPLYDATYTCALASRESTAEPMLSRVVGKHCENGDVVVRDLELPADLVPGDLLAVATTGAYCRALASNYNHVPRPGVVAVSEGRARLIVRPETEADLLRLDVE